MGLSQGYGAVDEDAAVATVRHAIDAGVTLLDTAMSYGTGHNERLIGRAVAGRRDEVTLATKFGIVRGPDGVTLDGHPDRVAGYCDASLARLGVDTIDLYYLHRVDPTVPVADTVGAMSELVAAGKVRYLGVSEVGPDDLAAAVSVHPIAAVQFEWSLFWRAPEADVVPAARGLGVGLVPYSPLGRGMLTGGVTAANAADSMFRATDSRFAGSHLDRNLAAVRALGELAAARDLTASQLALAWLLARGDDVVPIPGTRNPARVTENAAAADVSLGPDELSAVESIAGWSGDRTSFAAHGTERG